MLSPNESKIYIDTSSGVSLAIFLMNFRVFVMVPNKSTRSKAAGKIEDLAPNTKNLAVWNMATMMYHCVFSTHS